ncbi:zinc metallopeptidase [Fulvivirga sediminis]|uniref:Zinc metallopeptidase n=1 Tax=Fulvivirga sediminis TaxID=2803949 RepID=A0A937F280_9BACT|nr:zinc metallopeptidase [Fulvivirga sediminis]MBL3654932.1 zinc metallopeptidase [Fulvivirga sediminis]
MIFVIIIVFGILSFAVQSRLKNKFKKYSQVPLNKNLSGAEIAKLMLADHGIHDVQVVSVSGHLSDHYNPANKTVNLSEGVYHGRNAAAAAVASHECGHAVQHATAYSMLEFRSAMVPVQNASAKILNIIMMVMLFGGFFLFQTFPVQLVLLVIIGAYGVMTLFSLVTLPVEFDASKRALAWVKERHIVDSNEYGMAKDALKWAAMTYVVAALASLVTLLYYVSIFLGNRD